LLFNGGTPILGLVVDSIQSKADASDQALQVPPVSLADINPPEWAVNLIAQSPIASVISDPRLKDNPIIAVNQPFIELTGYAEDEILGRNCRFLAGAGTEPWLTELIREGVQDHRPVLVEILNYKKDGSAFRNAVLVAPIYDSDDELLYFLGMQVEVDEGNGGIFTARRSRAAQLVKTLSPRQLEVTKLVAQGLRNKEIAYELGLAEKTVKMHRGLVMEKLDLRTSADLIRIAVEAGI